MARLNDDAQWIVLMGFLISLSFFVLAIILNQSVVVGQTTAEGVLEFPKNDIRDFRQAAMQVTNTSLGNDQEIKEDFRNISLNRKNAVVDYNVTTAPYSMSYLHVYEIFLHYSNGVSTYNETTYV